MLAPFVCRFVEVADRPLHVADFGGEGSPVVCVHGLGGSHINWVSVAGELSRLGHVTALDLPGLGLSPVGESSMEGHRRILGDYLRTLGQPALVVANSMGGIVAVLEAAAEPDLFSGLVLVSPASPRAPGVWPDATITSLFSLYLVPGLAQAALAARRARMTPDEIAQWTLDLCALHPERIPADVVEAHVEVAVRRNHLPGADRAIARTARSMLRLLARPSVYDRAVAAVRAPTLVLQGRADRLVRFESALRLGALRPDWDVQILEGVGHVAMLEAPTEVVNLVSEWRASGKAA